MSKQPKQPKQPEQPKHPLHILILSDLHFGKQPKIIAPKDWYKKFEKKSIDFLKKRGKKYFDLILVPGDLVDRCGKSTKCDKCNNNEDCDEHGYKDAQDFFDKLTDSPLFDEQKTRILFSPGNHDIRTDLLLDILEENKEQIKNLKIKSATHKAVDELFNEIAKRCYKKYKRFVSRYNHKLNNEYRLYGFYPFDDIKISVLSLNSSWLCLGEKKWGELLKNDEDTKSSDLLTISLGDRVYDKIFKKFAPKNYDDEWFKIVMFHHNPYFLNYSDIKRTDSSVPILEKIEPYKDLLVCGHSHYEYNDGGMITAPPGPGYGEESGFTILEVDRYRRNLLTYYFMVESKNGSFDFKLKDNEAKPILYGGMSAFRKIRDDYTSEDYYNDRHYNNDYYYYNDNKLKGSFRLKDMVNINRISEIIDISTECKLSVEKIDEKILIERPMLKEDLETELRLLWKKHQVSSNKPS